MTINFGSVEVTDEELSSVRRHVTTVLCERCVEVLALGGVSAIAQCAECKKFLCVCDGYELHVPGMTNSLWRCPECMRDEP